jgi:hypothetical protein
MLYLYIRFGDPFIFFKIQKFWAREVSGFFVKNLWEVYYRNIFEFSYFGSRMSYLYSVMLMIIPIVFILFSLWLIVIYKKAYLWVVFLLLALIIVPSSTGMLLSINRYVLMAAPVSAFIAAVILPKRQCYRLLAGGYLFVSTVLLFIFSAAFLTFVFVG